MAAAAGPVDRQISVARKLLLELWPPSGVNGHMKPGESVMTRSFILVAALPLAIAACTPTDQRTAVGALGGAAVGAAVSSDSDRTKGAVVGAIVGATAANLLGPAQQPGQCRYQDQYGNTYIAACP
jgi:hypothetical protein